MFKGSICYMAMLVSGRVHGKEFGKARASKSFSFICSMTFSAALLPIPQKNDHPDMQRMLGIFRAVFAMRNKQEKNINPPDFELI